MTDSIPTDFLVKAQIRRAASQGVAITLLRRGDANSGAIALKINLLNGQARALCQVRDDDTLVWSPLGERDPMDEKKADQCLADQAGFDPDLWLIEIEDKEGRLWFPGRIVNL